MEVEVDVKNINDLPEEVLEYILSQLSPYRDLKCAMQVCHKWHRLITGVMRQLQQNFHHSIWESRVNWTSISPEIGANITERYSHCACYFNKSVYVFGGCTSTNTTFNDLWRFDLTTREWIRPLAMGTYPSPKACASMVVYGDSLVLFGGWSHPTPYPLHQAARFFSEMHIYKPDSNRWYHVTTVSPRSPAAVAGHSASIVGDLMVVFGGSQIPGAGTNEVWTFNFNEMVWHKNPTTENKPAPRYGQTQVTIDESHVLVIGGCGGPNQIFNDLWILNLDTYPLQWEEVRMKNTDFAAPQLWCHPACKVGDTLVVLSKPAKPPQASTVVSKESHAPPGITFRSNKLWVPPREDKPNQGATGTDTAKLFKRPVSDAEDSSGNESDDSLSQKIDSIRPEFKHPANVLGSQRTRSPTVINSSRSPGHSPAMINSSRSPGQSSTVINSARSPGQASSSRYQNLVQLDNASDSDGIHGTSSVRPGQPSVRPNAMRNRQKQLEALRKFEDKLRASLTASSTASKDQIMNSKQNTHSKSSRDPRSPVHLHVLDISKVVSDKEATWRPVRENLSLNAPEETIFYSLIEGRGELVMFGGIQRDITTMQRGMDIKSQVVSNNLCIISPWQQRL